MDYPRRNPRGKRGEEVNDTLGLVVLALSLGVIRDGLTLGLVAAIVGALAILFGGLWVVVPLISRWFFKRSSQESYFEFLFVVALVFGAASLAEGLGLAGILGAFVAGIGLNREIARGGALMNRIEFFGNAFFIPFFLFHVGMFVDPAVIFSGTETLLIAAVILSVLGVTKYVAARSVGYIQGYSPNATGVIFGLSLGQAAGALAITLLGFEAGVFSPAVLNAVVVMVLVSAVVSPWLTERYGRQLVTEGEAQGTAGEAYDPRVLLPLSQQAQRQNRLLECAIALKDSPAVTPVHLLTVLDPWATDDDIAAAETALSNAAETGRAAEVPVEVQTRVNHNVASAIARATVETRADLILLGWDRRQSLSKRVLGDTITQVRRQTTDPLLVAQLERPINTTSRLLFVFPPAIAHHEGFSESVYLMKRLAENLGTDIEALLVGTRVSASRYEQLLAEVPPERSITVTPVEGWDGLRTRISNTEPADLVVPITPREGGIGYSPQLRRLPQQIADAPAETFLILTPRRGEPGYAARFLRLE